MSVTKEKLRIAWEERADEWGSSLEGVLPKKFPPTVNVYLDQGHRLIVVDKFLPLLPTNAKLIDIACGYGRLSASVTESRPDIHLLGLDIAFPYCKLYQQNLQYPSFCGSIGNPPFSQGSFDGLMAITALMYVSKPRVDKTLFDLIMLLKPGGIAIFIDPGLEYLNLANVLIRSKEQTITSGRGFSMAEYDKLGQSPFVEVIARGGFPGFSFMIPLIYLLKKHSKIVERLLIWARIADDKFFYLRKLSFHRWMIVKRI